jgi:hypothetical protein
MIRAKAITGVIPRSTCTLKLLSRLLGLCLEIRRPSSELRTLDEVLPESDCPFLWPVFLGLPLSATGNSAWPPEESAGSDHCIDTARLSASVDGHPSNVHLVLFPYSLGILGCWKVRTENGDSHHPVHLDDFAIARARTGVCYASVTGAASIHG